jgi:hypothetical protein
MILACRVFGHRFTTPLQYVALTESPRGDMIRSRGGTPEQIGLGLGTGFVAQKAGKRSVVIDITTECGSNLVRKLSSHARSWSRLRFSYGT